MMNAINPATMGMYAAKQEGMMNDYSLWNEQWFVEDTANGFAIDADALVNVPRWKMTENARDLRNHAEMVATMEDAPAHARPAAAAIVTVLDAVVGYDAHVTPERNNGLFDAYIAAAASMAHALAAYLKPEANNA